MWLFYVRTLLPPVVMTGTGLLLLYVYCQLEEERKAQEQKNKERHAWVLWMVSRTRARLVSRKAY